MQRVFIIKIPSGDNELSISAIIKAGVFKLAKMKSFAAAHMLVFAHSQLLDWQLV